MRRIWLDFGRRFGAPWVPWGRHVDPWGRHVDPTGAILAPSASLFGVFLATSVLNHVFSAFRCRNGAEMRIFGTCRCGLYIVNNGSERMSALFGPASRLWHPMAPFWSHFGMLWGSFGVHFAALGCLLGFWAAMFAVGWLSFWSAGFGLDFGCGGGGRRWRVPGSGSLVAGMCFLIFGVRTEVSLQSGAFSGVPGYLVR